MNSLFFNLFSNKAHAYYHAYYALEDKTFVFWARGWGLGIAEIEFKLEDYSYTIHNHVEHCW
jgi:hypothetical protein